MISNEVVGQVVEAVQGMKTFQENASAEIKQFVDRVDMIEAKMNRRQPTGSSAVSSIVCTAGNDVLKSDGFRLLKSGQSSTGRIAVKAAITGLPVGSPQEHFPVAPQRAVEIHGYGFAPLGLTSVLRAVPVRSNVYEYVRVRHFSEGAAVQATEGATKAESSLAFDLQRANVVTVAHFVKASRQVLDDAPQLQSYIDRLMTFDLSQKLEDEFLNASDDGAGIDGFLDVVSVYAGAGDRMVDRLAYAIATLQARGYAPSAIVMSPVRWAFFRTLTDGEDRYLSGGFSVPAPPSLWGVPVVVSSKISDNEILIGDFANGAEMLLRQEATVEVAYDGDDFTRNLVTIRAELRAGLAILVPAAFVVIPAGSPDI